MATLMKISLLKISASFELATKSAYEADVVNKKKHHYKGKTELFKTVTPCSHTTDANEWLSARWSVT